MQGGFLSVAVLTLSLLMLSACGGGGGSSGSTSTSGAGGPYPSGSSTPVGSYIADSLGTGFTGLWLNTSFSGSTASAVAATYNLTSTATANTYALTGTAWTLSTTGVWSTVTSAPATNVYDLVASGWAAEGPYFNFVDSGDGVTASVQNTANGFTLPYSFAQTSLAGMSITCYSATNTVVACATPGAYPSGASRYTLTLTATAHYLFGTAGITDASGIPLTAYPGAATTFCDPYTLFVYQPTATMGVYNVFGTTACTPAAISSALVSASMGTVTITQTATGNAAVPYVLVLSSWTGGLAAYSMFPSINFTYGLRAGNVYFGTDVNVGYTAMAENKTAVNAELTATGFAPLP